MSVHTYIKIMLNFLSNVIGKFIIQSIMLTSYFYHSCQHFSYYYLWLKCVDDHQEWLLSKNLIEGRQTDICCIWNSVDKRTEKESWAGKVKSLKDIVGKRPNMQCTLNGIFRWHKEYLFSLLPTVQVCKIFWMYRII